MVRKGSQESPYLRFTCRTVESASILRQAMKDRAEERGIAVYTAFEEALFESCLPTDQMARHYAWLVLGEEAGVWAPPNEGMAPVQHALLEAFEVLADMDNGFWELPETIELVHHLGRYFEGGGSVIESHGEQGMAIMGSLDTAARILRRDLESLAHSLPMSAGSNVICGGRQSGRFAAERGLCELLFAIERQVEEAKNKGGIAVSGIFEALPVAWLEAWEYPQIREMILTLIECASTEGDGIKERTTFIGVCRAVMPAWSVEALRCLKVRESAQRARMIEGYEIKGGIHYCPATWKVANPEAAGASNYAAKVFVTNVAPAGLPEEKGNVDANPRVVLLPCPFEDVGENEEERVGRVIEMAEKEWIDLRKIKDSEVTLKRGKNGQPLNWDEWKNSTRLFVTEILEASPMVARANEYEAWIEKSR